MPVLEAMSCGAAVITSNCSSLPEVGGDSVQYCNPLEHESIVEAIELLLTKPSLQKELREKAQFRSKQFSWEKTVRETKQVYLRYL